METHRLGVMRLKQDTFSVERHHAGARGVGIEGSSLFIVLPLC